MFAVALQSSFKNKDYGKARWPRMGGMTDLLNNLKRLASGKHRGQFAQ
jgi:hypothetical protein